jgi:hypothetical protein
MQILSMEYHQRIIDIFDFKPTVLGSKKLQ